VVALILVGCGAPAPLAERQLYDEANTQFEAGNFESSTRNFATLLEQYPFSDLAEASRLRIAHAYYLNRDYEKAIAAFNDFERLHPTSPSLPFVGYTIGMSYLDQDSTRDRDSSASENALQQFERVRNAYPDSLYARLAEFRARRCRENLADHEIFVGDYYADRGKPAAARARYEYVLSNYPRTDAAVIARERVARMSTEPTRPPKASRAD
jgi:outer membrane protein assembly factor BamD